MSNSNDMGTAGLIEGLDDEAKLELLERLAEELGFDLAEQSEHVDPQTDILDVITNAVRSLEKDLSALQAQFAEGTELEYAVLDQVSDGVEFAISELIDAHESLNALIDSEFDVDEEDEEEEEE